MHIEYYNSLINIINIIGLKKILSNCKSIKEIPYIYRLEELQIINCRLINDIQLIDNLKKLTLLECNSDIDILPILFKYITLNKNVYVFSF